MTILKLPPQQRRPNRKTSANTGQQYQVALLQPAILQRRVHRQRNRRCRRIPIAVDIDHHMLLRHPQPLRRRQNDPLVRLVRNEAAQIPSRYPVASQHSLRRLRHLANRKLVNRLPILVHKMHLCCDRLRRRRMQAPAARHIQRRGTRSIDLMVVVDQSDLAVFARLQQHRTRAIAKDHASRPVRVVDDRAHHIRSNHQHLLVHPALNQLRPYLQRVRKTRARRRKIEPPRALRSNLVLHQASRRRKKHIRCHRSHDDHLNLARVDPPRLQAALRRCHRQIARPYARLHNMPFADASPLSDPLVVRRDHLLQVGVRQQLGRNIGPHGTDLCAHPYLRLQRQTQSITSLPLQNTKLLHMRRDSQSAPILTHTAPSVTISIHRRTLCDARLSSH